MVRPFHAANHVDERPWKMSFLFDNGFVPLPLVTLLTFVQQPSSVSFWRLHSAQPMIEVDSTTLFILLIIIFPPTGQVFLTSTAGRRVARSQPRSLAAEQPATSPLAPGQMARIPVNFEDEHVL